LNIIGPACPSGTLGGSTRCEHTKSAHLGPQKIPVGGNLLYLDGLTEWQRFEAMRVRTTGTPPFWW
jgi:hypothetical protein